MCGKFTAMASWSDVVKFSQPLGEIRPREGGGGDDAGANDEEITYRVNGLLPVIVWDAAEQRRRVVRMRWGYPSRQDWRRPQPIHARAETAHELKSFRDSFAEGRRGIVVFKTFNEGEEVTRASGTTYTKQWTIDPCDGVPRGFAFLWDRFDLKDLPAPMYACVMVTVPASELIKTKIMPNDPDPRMPAILADEDWATWLGEVPASIDQARAVLKTVEGVHWHAAPEVKKPKG